MNIHYPGPRFHEIPYGSVSSLWYKDSVSVRTTRRDQEDITLLYSYDINHVQPTPSNRRRRRCRMTTMKLLQLLANSRSD